MSVFMLIVVLGLATHASPQANAQAQTQSASIATSTPSSSFNNKDLLSTITATAQQAGTLDKITFGNSQVAVPNNWATRLKVNIGGIDVLTSDYATSSTADYKTLTISFISGYSLKAGDEIKVTWGGDTTNRYPSAWNLRADGKTVSSPTTTSTATSTTTTSTARDTSKAAPITTATTTQAATSTSNSPSSAVALASRQPARSATTCEKGANIWVASSKGGEGRTTTDFYQMIQGQTSFETIQSASPWVYNAIAYNPADNWIYAISQGKNRIVANDTGQGTAMEDPNYPAGNLLQIDPETGAVFNLGHVKGAFANGEGFQGTYRGSYPNDLWGGINTGFFDGSGNYWVANASDSGTHRLYKVDIAKMTAAMQPSKDETKAGTGQNWSVLANDHAVLRDVGDYAWGIRNTTNTMERINLTTGAVATWSLNSVKDPATGATIPAGTYGTAWNYGNGNLGFGNNTTNTSYQIKITNPTSATPKFDLVSVTPAPTSSNNDGTSNGSASGTFNVDLKAEKTAIGYVNGVMTWDIKVSNLGPCGSSGFTIDDTLPTGYTAPTIVNDGGAVSSGITGNVVRLSFGPLLSGETRTVRVSAKTTNSKVCPANVATVTGNENDPTPANNSSTAPAQCPAAKKLDLEVAKVDALGNTQMLPGASFEIRTANGQVVSTTSKSEGKLTALLDAGTYYLVETKAPTGYELLASPVGFTIEWSDSAQTIPKVTLLNSAKDGLSVSAGNRQTVGILSVADVRSGSLPKTGGIGVAPLYALATFFLLAAGVVVQRNSRGGLR